MTLLPDIRPVLVDFAGGEKPEGVTHHLVPEAGMDELYPLLREIGFKGDLWRVCPWRDGFPKQALHDLTESTVRSVGDAFQTIIADNIGSLEGNLFCALDLGTMRSEIILTAPEGEMQRLFFTPDALFPGLKAHCWAHLTLDGVATTWWAPRHLLGVKAREVVQTEEEFQQALRRIDRLKHNCAAQIHVPQQLQADTVALWRDALSEWKARHGLAEPNWRISLGDGDRLVAKLSAFEKQVNEVNCKSADLLWLHGRSIAHLFVDKGTRARLQRVVGSEQWRVHPGVTEAIADSVAGLAAARSPLRPLTGGMRLAFVDELEVILCLRDLPLQGMKVFQAGKRYPVKCHNEMASRNATRVNMQGIEEDVFQFGEERITAIHDDAGCERRFADLRHFKDLDGSLEVLLDHFDPETPNSVREMWPDRFQEKISAMHALQESMNRQIELLSNRHGKGRQTPLTHFAFKSFQIEDYAALALTNGAVLGHEFGGGKGIAAFALPLIWLGITEAAQGIQPKGPVLIVAPEALHQKAIKEGRDKFGITNITKLYSQKDYTSLILRHDRLPAGWYVTSYTQLTGNGTRPLPDPGETEQDLNTLAQALCVTDVDINRQITHDIFGEPMTPEWRLRRACEKKRAELQANLGREVRGIRCVYVPSLLQTSLIS